MKVDFKELRKEWETKFKNGCKNLEENELCKCFKKDHYALDETPVLCNMHTCPDFKPKIGGAMKKLGEPFSNKKLHQKEEKVAPKEEKEIEVDKI